MNIEPFDPLAVEHIGVTLAVELIQQPLHPLPPGSAFPGAGVYAIYYSGGHPAYSKLVAMDGGKGGAKYPVYIGSAVRESAKQGFSPRPTSSARIWNRLRDHAESIKAVETAGVDRYLKSKDFHCRFLVLNDAHITLAESVLITTFRPAWNGMGFGSKVVGIRREGQLGSLWDSLHAGRGGRPSGTSERAQLARSKVEESIAALSITPTDARTAKMLEKIRQFL